MASSEEIQKTLSTGKRFPAESNAVTLSCVLEPAATLAVVGSTVTRLG
jgi:hypothetical protein